MNCCSVQIVDPSHPSTTVDDTPPQRRPRVGEPASPGGLYAAVDAVKSCGARRLPSASAENRSTTPALTNSFVPAALNPMIERPLVEVAIDGTQ